MKEGYPNPWNFFCYQWFYVKVHKALMYAPWLKLDFWYNRGKIGSVIIQFNVTSFVNKSWKLTSIFLFNIRAIRKTRTPVFSACFFLFTPPPEQRDQIPHIEDYRFDNRWRHCRTHSDLKTILFYQIKRSLALTSTTRTITYLQFNPLLISTIVCVNANFEN